MAPHEHARSRHSANGAARFGRATLVAGVVGLGDAHRRLLTILLRFLGARRAYAFMGGLARRFYDSADRVRRSSEDRCRAALGGQRSEAEIKAISRSAFVHRIWNLTDLMLAPRLLRPQTLERCGCRVPEPYGGLLLDAQERGRPVILVTTYYGPYDLLPVVLGLNGIRALAVYRPHPNRRYDRYRQAVRTSSGCTMMTQAGAALGIDDALAAGRTVALLVDPADAGKGIPVSFLGGQMTVPRTVGLLAEHYEAIVAVAAIRRLAEPFTFEVDVSDFFRPDDWRDQPDAAAYCTQRYCAALERLVLEAPEQYLWLRSDARSGRRRGDARRSDRKSDSPGQEALQTTC